MLIIYHNPQELLFNSWNPNSTNPIDQEKLVNSLREDGLNRAILIRTLDDGSKEIVGGEHRTRAAIELGWHEIPCVDLGIISDGEAKKKGLIDNYRYGDDDPLKLADILGDIDVGSAEDLLSTLPLDEESLTAFFDHELDIDLDALDNLDEEEDLGLDINAANTTPTKTHQILRFKVSMEDAVGLTDLITRTKHEQGFTESDDLTNAGDALIFLSKGVLTSE